jgi:hypothetical protein
MSNSTHVVMKDYQRNGATMKLTKAEIAMLKESLHLGIENVRNGTADYKQREAKINEMQALSRKLTQMANEAEA